MQRSSSYSPPPISDSSSRSSPSSTNSSSQITSGGYSDYYMPLATQGYPFSGSYNSASMPTGMTASSYYGTTASAAFGGNSSCLSSQYSRTYPFNRYTSTYNPSSNGLLSSCGVESANYYGNSYTQQHDETSPTSTLPPSPQSSPPHSYSPSGAGDETVVSKSLYDNTNSTSPQSTSPPPSASSSSFSAAAIAYRTAYNGSTTNMSYSSLPLWTASTSEETCVDSSSTTNTASYHLMNSCGNVVDNTITSSSYYSLPNGGGAGGSHYNYSATSYPVSTSNVYYSPSYQLSGGAPTAGDYSAAAYQTPTAFALWNYPSFQVSPVSKVSYDSPRYKLTPERAIPLLKWFEEHKEHPYPSRHEKMVLCQSTQLTFTQVSTWFANARRRLKKAAQDEEEEEEDLENEENVVKSELNVDSLEKESKLLKQ